MSNPVLQSESFDKAAYALQHSLERGLRTDGFEHSVTRMGEIVDQFTATVDRMTKAMGMQAENQSCVEKGQSPPYDGEAFFSL